MTYALNGAFLAYPDPDGPAESLFVVDNFVVETTFVNPAKDDDGQWDYGVLFGTGDNAPSYHLYVSSTGEWFIEFGQDQIASGESQLILTELRERNTVRVIVSGDRCILFVNGELMTSTRLEEPQSSYQLWLVTTNVDSSDIAFLDLNVWALT